MVELDQYRYKISDYDKPLQQIKNSLDLDNKQKRIEEREADMEAPGFWDDTEKSQKAMKELKALKDSFEKYDALVRGLEDTKTTAFRTKRMWKRNFPVCSSRKRSTQWAQATRYGASPRKTTSPSVSCAN